MNSKKMNIERNKMDYLLTDIMPVEVSELFSYEKFYNFLLSERKEVNEIIKCLKNEKASNQDLLFDSRLDGDWASIPLKYNILKGVNSSRELNLVQPIAALNIYLFVECYQKEILDVLEDNSCFSLRYHRKNNDLFYKKKNKGISEYFEKVSKGMDKAILQQTGAYFKIYKYSSIASFTSSRLWQQCNLKYGYFAKIDYKSCFNSIYTHTYKWIIEKDTIDSKQAKNSNLYIVIDRVLQNINGRSSNGVIIGPEFSRMIAEILLQHIDVAVKRQLECKNIYSDKDYRIFRYVDDMFIFANNPTTIDTIINTIEEQAQVYLLRLNELKISRSETPVMLSDWLIRTRMLSDKIAGLFNRISDIKGNNTLALLKKGYLSIDRFKSEFISIIKSYPDDQRHVVSYLLSTVLNKISRKKDGFQIFEDNKTSRAFALLDFVIYIYSYCPCFEHTQKVISMIVYMNDEVKFREDGKQRLKKLMHRYSFIFEKGNLNDLCNWFIFFKEFRISLTRSTEQKITSKLINDDNPILWANYLIYSKYLESYNKKILQTIEHIIEIKINQIGNQELLLHKEFWYIIIFNNCPYLSQSLKAKIRNEVNKLQKGKGSEKCVGRLKKLLFKFMTSDNLNQFFYWDNNHFKASEQLTFRTYQRTLFRQYRKKGSLELYGSLDI